VAIKLPRLRREIPVVEESRGPSLPFQQWLDISFKQIEQSTDQITLALAAAGIALDQSGQALTVAIREVTESGAVLSNDYIVLADATAADIVLDLPPAADNTGALVTVKKTDASANTVTVDADDAETIDGATTKVLTTQYETIRLVCDGVEWWVI
jgi:hypothetical protein